MLDDVKKKSFVRIFREVEVTGECVCQFIRDVEPEEEGGRKKNKLLRPLWTRSPS